MNISLFLDIFRNQRLDEQYYKECFSKGKKIDSKKLIDLKSTLTFPIEKGIEIRKHPNFLPEYLHTHEFFELCIVLKGKAKHTIFNEVVNQEEGDLIFLPPSVYHSIAVFDDSIVLNLLLSKKFIHSLYPNLSAIQSSITEFFLNENEKKVLKYSTNYNDDYLNLIYLLCRVCRSKEIENIELNKSLFLSFLYLTIEKKGRELIYGEKSKGKVRALAITQYMKNNLEIVSMDILSDYFSLSRERIALILKDSLNTTYSSLLQQMRMEKAITLLTSSSLECKDIAKELGFTSLEHFSRAFKAWTGLSPTKFKTNLNEKLHLNKS